MACDVLTEGQWERSRPLLPRSYKTISAALPRPADWGDAKVLFHPEAFGRLDKILARHVVRLLSMPRTGGGSRQPLHHGDAEVVAGVARLEYRMRKKLACLVSLTS
jgi:hypothetical protein